MRARPFFFAVVVALAFAPRARADAVPPPPAHCPPGQIGVTSHGGPACVLAPPTDCAPGWRGVQGGTCALAVCDPDSPGCEPSQRCVAVDLCVTEEVRTWGYSSLPARRGPELAAPPRPLATPEHDFSAVDVCAAGGTCATGKCEALHVCLAAGDARPASAANAKHPTEKAYVRSVAENELDRPGAKGIPPLGDDATAPGDADAAVPSGPADAGFGIREVPSSAPRNGGCAGCAAASTRAPIAGGLAALAAIAALFARKKRR